MQFIMSCNHFRSSIAASLGALGLGLIALAGPAAAQDDTLPPWLHVVVVQLEGGQGAVFEDLLRDYLVAAQDAGQPASQVYQIAIGHPNEFHIVTPVDSVAGFETLPPPMPEGQAVLWQSRITDTIDSVRFFYAATYPEHDIQAPANAQPPELLLLRKIRIAQGREAEYESWVADQYMPAFRQSDPLGHTMAHSIYGDSLLNYYHAYPLRGWEELDGPDPLIEILGQRRYEQVFGAVNGIVTEHEMIVGRLRSDLMP